MKSETVKENGIEYSNGKQKRTAHYNDNENDIMIYEIYHPGYRIKIKEKDK